ncbi:MAG: hypothetical protein K0S14_22 [Thermomicrobiales bacterium]|jgi:hypothetical protein|nr:hypothetical protein [Thermomicrobiales bacterium]
MSKPSGQQTVTNTPDEQTQRYRDEVMDAARNASRQQYTPYGGAEVAGMRPEQTMVSQRLGGLYDQYGNLANQGAVQQFNGNQFVDQGLFGARALAGDQDATQQMMNPYLSGVVDQVKGQYGDLNAAAQTGIQDQATKAGAFGGSRHGVASGVASAEIAKGLGSQIAGLQHQGFNDAMGRASGLANLGLGGMGMAQNALGFQAGMTGAQQGVLGQQYGIGEDRRQIGQQQLDVNRRNFNEQRDWGLRNFDILKSGATGMPYGQTTSQPLHSNPAAGFLGGAASGASIGSFGGPIGAGIGAGVGGFLGLF